MSARRALTRQDAHAGALHAAPRRAVGAWGSGTEQEAQQREPQPRRRHVELQGLESSLLSLGA